MEFTTPKPSIFRQISTVLHNHPGLFLLLLLALPLGWMLLVYIGSLIGLLIQSFFYLDGFTGQVVRQFSLRTYGDLFTRPHMEIFGRTVAMAAAVTVGAALMAFPLAYYTVRYTSRRRRAILYLLILLPLWSSYIIRVYSWKLILAKEGIISWFVGQLGLTAVLDWILQLPVIGGPSLSISSLGLFLVFLYIWLPYMILPIMASLERVPKSLGEASGDLGARPSMTFRYVTLPLSFPGVVAGSIFTFSLTLGDYIIPSVIGDSSPFIGMTVYSYQGTSGNIPLAAAFTVLPITIMAVYLLVARRLGAFEAL
ncbi:MAG: ABC transporter permease [Chloroflexota bacterium]|nr:ABC transporter permease [Ardenticatenaceae bacterium]GIK58957.1 MAG: ABC transporter permease [Chloroflexota bacterium]